MQDCITYALPYAGFGRKWKCEKLVVQKCMTYALPYASFGRKWECEKLVMQKCITYALGHAGFGRKWDPRKCGYAKVHKLCTPLCKFQQKMRV